MASEHVLAPAPVSQKFQSENNPQVGDISQDEG